MMQTIFKGVEKTVFFKELNFIRLLQTAVDKKQSGIATEVDYEEAASEYNSARPLESIPGPKPLPIPYVGNLWRFLPFGTYGNTDHLDVHHRLYKEYGPIVRLSGMGFFDHVLLYKPEHVEKMYRNETTWPLRRPLYSLKYYRDHVRKDFYQDQKGLITSNGEEWHKFRTTTNQVMLIPRNVKSYLNSVVEVGDEFLERMRNIRKENGAIPGNFMGEINRLSLETFALMTLDTRIGCLKNDITSGSDAMLMIKYVREAMALMYELDARPSLWRFYATKNWKKFVRAMDFIVEYTNKQILSKWEKIKNQNTDDSGNKSLLESLLLSTKDPKIPVVMASDVLFAAIDTTSSTTANALYLLAVNPDKQENLFQELKKILPNKNTTITEDIFNQLKYTRAVIKETMRLRPTAPVNQREAGRNMVFDNYQIPEGTALLSIHAVMCQMEKYFKNASAFIPERWLKSQVQTEYSHKNTNPFVYQPFGFGPRSCIGKRFAYMEMDVVISKIIRNFKVIYHGEPMTWTTKLILTPNKPLTLSLIERPK